MDLCQLYFQGKNIFYALIYIFFFLTKKYFISIFIIFLYAQLHLLAILTLNILYRGYVQQQGFPEGDFLSKQGDFRRSREF